MVLDTIDGKLGGTSNPKSLLAGVFVTADTDMRDLDPSATADDGVCDVCHKASGTVTTHPDSLHAGNHNLGGTGTSCMSCHDHKKSFQGTCNTCHGYPPVTAAEDAASSDPNLVTENYAGGGGQHLTHVTFLKSKLSNSSDTKEICGPCHGDNAGDAATGNHNGSGKLAGAWLESQARNFVNLRSRAAAPSSWGASATYNGQLVTSAGTAVPPADAMDVTSPYTDNRCANVDCHGNPSVSDTVEVLHWNVDLTANAGGAAANGKEKSRTCEGCHDETPATVRVYNAAGTSVDAATVYYGTRSGYARGGHGDANIQTEDPAPGFNGRPDATGTTPLECTACHDDAVAHFPEPAAPGNLYRLINQTIDDTGAGGCRSCHPSGDYPANHHPDLLAPMLGQQIYTDPSTWSDSGGGVYEQNGYQATTFSGNPDRFINWWGGSYGLGNQDPPPTPSPLAVLPLERFIRNTGASNLILCVTCHNPHGTDLFTYDVNDISAAPGGPNATIPDNNMLRVRDQDGTLCNACH
jgi:hypothetical protein